MATDLSSQFNSIDLNIAWRNLPDSWGHTLKEDYINKTDSFSIIAASVDNISVQVDTNTENITTNTENIAINADNIADNTTAITNHVNSNSQHGVTGDNVGTGDFAQTSVGGVVLLAASTADIASPDATAAPAAYDQVQIESIVTLVNEAKAQVNDLLASLRASGAINT